MKKLTVVVVVLAVVVVIGWAVLRRSEAPEVPFARLRRQTLVSTVETNGKADPVSWVAVRSLLEGKVGRVAVEPGQKVRRGTVLARLVPGPAALRLAAAEARIRTARAQLRALDQGGPALERAAIESDLAQARLEQAAAAADLSALERLLKKHAATPYQVMLARQRLQKAKLRLSALEKRRAALVSPVSRQEIEARLKAALADAEEARGLVKLGLIRAPMAGVVYRLAVRPGTYLHPGDLVANVGRTTKLRIHILVDEPELGRVAVGMPVKITWDALPGRKWEGKVTKMPASITRWGTRKGGEVLAVIENRDGDLPPGADVNVVIRSRVVQNALTIPKEALRRRGSENGVYALSGNVIHWRKVKLGISSITRAQVTGGLGEADAVALPTEIPLHDGMEVRPVYP